MPFHNYAYLYFIGAFVKHIDFVAGYEFVYGPSWIEIDMIESR